MTAKLVIDKENPNSLDDSGNRRFARVVGARHYDEMEALGPPRLVTDIEAPPDLVDFEDGFAAGYHAKADHRAVLGSPAYRLGHAEGVQAATERRLRAAVRPGRYWRDFWSSILIGILIGLGLGVFITPAKADALADWQQLNEVCQGGRAARADRACAQREPVASKLRASGWYQGGHGVWVSPEHVAAFYRVVRSYDATARANPGMLDKVMTGMMTDLRRAVPDEAIFALWNGSAGDLLAHTPYAAAMLMHGLPYLERTLSGKNDPRFVMVLKP